MSEQPQNETVEQRRARLKQERIDARRAERKAERQAERKAERQAERAKAKAST